MITVTIGKRQGRRTVELSKQEAKLIEEALHQAIWFGVAPPPKVEGIEVGIASRESVSAAV